MYSVSSCELNMHPDEQKKRMAIFDVSIGLGVPVIFAGTCKSLTVPNGHDRTS